jgi:hypothetical protein
MRVDAIRDSCTRNLFTYQILYFSGDTRARRRMTRASQFCTTLSYLARKPFWMHVLAPLPTVAFQAGQHAATQQSYSLQPIRDVELGARYRLYIASAGPLCIIQKHALIST